MQFIGFKGACRIKMQYIIDRSANLSVNTNGFASKMIALPQNMR